VVIAGPPVPLGQRGRWAAGAQERSERCDVIHHSKQPQTERITGVIHFRVDQNTTGFGPAPAFPDARTVAHGGAPMAIARAHYARYDARA
jgi:hypothetical protein